MALGMQELSATCVKSAMASTVHAKASASRIVPASWSELENCIIQLKRAV